jgi:hypothetical protein
MENEPVGDSFWLFPWRTNRVYDAIEGKHFLMPSEFVVRVTAGNSTLDIPAILVQSGADAPKKFRAGKKTDGSHLLLTGDRDFYATLSADTTQAQRSALTASKGRYVSVVFAGRTAVRRLLGDLKLAAEAAPSAPGTVTTNPIDLTEGIPGRAPLFLLSDGTFSTKANETQRELIAREALVNAARWISSRRTSTFERLFPASAFHPDLAARTERVTTTQARALLDQVRGALRVAAVGSAEAIRNADEAAQLRSAALTVLSHMVATVLRDESWRSIADLATAEIFSMIQAEQHAPSAKPQLRAHAVLLLQLRAPALSPEDRARAVSLVQTLVREKPPYESLRGAWNFAMCSAYDFHDGECAELVKKYGFKSVDAPKDAPKGPRNSSYQCFEAPFKNPSGNPITVYARKANPSDENTEMASTWFVGLLINRHAQLGSFDMRATAVAITQQGYKLMMNSQCAGLTTRFALSRMFPDADLYSSWDSTYFRNDSEGKLNESEGLDCFVAVLQGMARGETHNQLDRRIHDAQWYHPQQDTDRSFVQFVGPAHPTVIARYSDVNHDGHGDFYDGFFDFTVQNVSVEMTDALTPRDPGVKASQVGGAAARSLDWAAGSMNRVTQYSDLWAALPGRSELFYAYEAGGYFSHLEAPQDVATGPFREDLSRLPAVCRYVSDGKPKPSLRVEVMFHAWLAHAPEELKRLLVAAEAMNRAFDLRFLPSEGKMSTPQARRGAILLTLAGLLEFPADQNRLDAIWSTGLRMLNFPDVSRNLVRRCITEEDHNASNYYGSVRGIGQLVGIGTTRGDLGTADSLAWERIASADPTIGRAIPLIVPVSTR